MSATICTTRSPIGETLTGVKNHGNNRKYWRADQTAADRRPPAGGKTVPQHKVRPSVRCDRRTIQAYATMRHPAIACVVSHAGSHRRGESARARTTDRNMAELAETMSDANENSGADATTTP